MGMICGIRIMRMVGIVAVMAMLTGFSARILGGDTNPSEKSSDEMKHLFDEDQADRQANMAAMTSQQLLDWTNKVGPRDAQRRKQVMDLVSRGVLHTGQDFEEAAFIFQHGDNPEDYLLAHTLATVAIAKGSSKSRWIAAATLDRYLQKIEQPQIYGTQYSKGAGQGDQFTQEPYDRKLVPDSLRAVLCVPGQATQQEVLEQLKRGKEPPEPKKSSDCS